MVLSHTKKIGYWVKDYAHLVHRHGYALLKREPPKHYLGHIAENKKPIILIPGVYEKWHFLKAIADPLSLDGHPIYVLEHLGYNTETIPETAKIIRKFIEGKKLTHVIIIAHSKGGIVGKYILAHENREWRVKKLIAIASPFHGSLIVRPLPAKNIFNPLTELSPDSEVIKNLNAEKEVNRHIVSIFGVFDNHVWPQGSSRLENAKNIEVETYGHHSMLSDKKVRDIVFAEVESA